MEARLARVFNGASRARTGDLLGAIQALSQLSYSPATAKAAVRAGGKLGLLSAHGVPEPVARSPSSPPPRLAGVHAGQDQHDLFAGQARCTLHRLVSEDSDYPAWVAYEPELVPPLGS